MIAILGGLGAACAWAISTLCSSRSSRIIEPWSVVAWVMLIGLLVSGPLAAADGIPSALGHSPGIWLLVSAAGNVAGLGLAYAALRIGQVALVAPLVSTEGGIAATIAVIAGESIAPGVGLTLAAIAFGIGLSAQPAEPAEEASRAEHRRTHLRAVLLAVIAAATFGTSLYATGRAGDRLPAAWVAVSARLVGTVVLVVPMLLRGRLQRDRRVVPLVIASGLCEVLGFFSFTAGARHGIAVAAIVSSQFATLAAIGGYLVFSERLSRVQLAGIATVVAGVAVLSVLRA